MEVVVIEVVEVVIKGEAEVEARVPLQMYSLWGENHMVTFAGIFMAILLPIRSVFRRKILHGLLHLLQPLEWFLLLKKSIISLYLCNLSSLHCLPLLL
jgi:hypothetical protein